MLALSFRAGTARFAVRATTVVRVLDAVPLRPVVAAPTAVIGLLPFEEDLVPVIDLGVLLEGQPTTHASRLLVAEVGGPRSRRLALAVAEAWDMVEIRAALPRLGRADHAFLGSFLREAGDAQLLELAELLPAELQALARVPLADGGP